MTHRSTLTLAVCASCLVANWCVAADTTTYTFTGVVSDSLISALGENTVGQMTLPAKGEFVYGPDGIVSIQFETAAATVTATPIASTGGSAFRLVASTLTSEHELLLRSASVTATNDGLTVTGLLADNPGASFALEATQVNEVGQSAAHRAARGIIGPDVTVSRLGLTSSGSGTDEFAYYGTANSIRAFSMASTSCNMGDEQAEWISGSSGNHPVISQHMYRLLNGRFEMIGQSWLKHSFCAVNEFTCGACQSTPCSTLGIGCADTYGSGLNDGAGGGPKSLINPWGFGSGGTHNNHSWAAPSGPTAIRGRLQISDADINAGGQNFAEVHYITHDEDPEDRHNNASWREVNLNLTSITGVGSGQASVHFQQPAIQAWQLNDPEVTIANVDVPNEGRFHLGCRVTDNGDGTWHYEYALHNMNSNRAAGSFSVPIPAGVNLTNIGFHDVDYHSGEPYSLTDWPATDSGGALTWATQPYAQNVNANALRWGTLYNFRFDADTAPVAATLTIGIFKPGDPTSVTVDALAPQAGIPCPADLDGNDGVDAGDLASLLGSWGPQDHHPADFDGDGFVSAADLAQLLGSWGPCP